MKQELPIAILLLAAGGLLWFWQSSANPETVYRLNQANTNDNQRQIGGVGNSLGLSFASADRVTASRVPATDASDGSFLEQASLVDAEGSKEDENTKVGVGRVSVPIGFSIDPAGRKFVESAGKQLRQAPGFRSDLQIQIEWMDESFVLAGVYQQIGQGSGQSRIDLMIPGATPLSITKVCDGRFLYTQTKTPAGQSLEFLDLNRVEKRRQDSGLTEPDNPMSWIARGGLASILENLGSAFEFGDIQQTESDGYQVSRLKGRWKQRHFHEMLRDMVAPDVIDLERGIDWQRLPSHLPHGVEIEFAQHLGEQKHLGVLPVRIEFLKFESVRNQATGSNQLVSQRYALIQFAPPVPLSISSEELLELKNDDGETIDATDQYVDQIRDFEYARQAAIDKSQQGDIKLR